MPEKKPERPLQKISDLSPRPHKSNQLLKNNKFMNCQVGCKLISKYFQIDHFKLKNVFIPKKKEIEEEYDDEDEDQPAYESQSEESFDEKRQKS